MKYKDYLKSEVWKEQRNFALGRTDGFCQFCGDVASQVHHVVYPKQFGKEHPHSLVPVCERCHRISHGIQDMKKLTDVTPLTELTPNGGKLRYILSGARVYASAKSWERALQVPETLGAWFLSGLPRTALLKKDLAGGELEASYMDTPVYRWHAVADLLRAFDRNWYASRYDSRTKTEQSQLEKFHQNYERLITWGYDLQEKALSSVLNPAPEPSPVTQDMLISAMKEVVAPRLRYHDDKLHEHDVVIAEIKDAIPTLRDQEEFISIRQAISEKSYDPHETPFHPRSNENLSNLLGQYLQRSGAERGHTVVFRQDSSSRPSEAKTYRRRDIYNALVEIFKNKQHSLPL